jgi:cell filamentation protein, protein adenylyltransferase
VNRGITGRYVRITSIGSQPAWAFVPNTLPPVPPLQVDRSLREDLDRALIALGRLDGVTALLPDPELFLYTYVRKEAVLSSQIEGTQSSLSDLLLFELDEAPGVPLDDVRDVSNYVAAMNHGVRRLGEGFPLSNRLLREIHGILLSKGRGEDKDPGEFRRVQNWIGGPNPSRTLFVPPPVDQVVACMGDLERFLDAEAKEPLLIKAALAHAQFETIHPFLDGNGRLGRLLITLILCADGALREPLLYLSLYLRRHRAEYYEQLQRLRTDGDWESWVNFFAVGVRETADQAVATAHSLVRLFDEDRARIQALGQTANSSVRLHLALQRRPLLSIRKAAEETGLSIPTVAAGFRALGAENSGIVRELTGKRRNRLFVYDKYLRILSEGLEPADTGN